MCGAYWASRNTRYATGKDSTKVDPALAPLPVYLGGLGMTGMTAYFGLLDVGQPKPGETVVISAAAGATGMIVRADCENQRAAARLALLVAPRSANSSSRNLDSTPLSITNQKTCVRHCSTHCPKGIDIYFDNVGGDILDAALSQLARGARVRFAARFRSTTTPRRSKDRRTTFRCSSIAP